MPWKNETHYYNSSGGISRIAKYGYYEKPLTSSSYSQSKISYSPNPRISEEELRKEIENFKKNVKDIAVGVSRWCLEKFNDQLEKIEENYEPINWEELSEEEKIEKAISILELSKEEEKELREKIFLR